jgi:FkbM family methyltransferase
VNAAAGRAPGRLLFYELWPSSSSTFEASQAEELIRQGRARLRRKYEVQIVPLRELVARHFAGQGIDLLSIDTEGRDTEVLEGLDWLITRPRLVVAEINAAGRADDSAAHFLLSQGYAHAARIACNAFFVRPD